MDLGAVRGEVRDVKMLLTTGLRAFSPNWPGEMLRTLRESNRISEERFAQLDVTLREQAIETHTILRTVADGQSRTVEGQRALVEGQRALVDSQHEIAETQRQLVESQRQLIDEQRELSAEMRALIARIDALIRRRGNGAPSD